MEEWEIKIITSNLDKLTINTSCSTEFLNKFQESKILSEEDVEQLSLPGDTRSTQVTKFYKKIVTREHGFTRLMEILKETNQSGARSILKTALTKRKLSDLDEIRSVSFDKDAVLGKGSNGTVVFKGAFGGRPVAVKRVNSDNEQEKMIVKEIENLKKCDRQENIVRYYGTNVVDNFILVVLELCDMTLKDWLPKKPINISPVELLRQVTVGLEWLHSRRIVHRDLKPENILLTSALIRAKISDFGLSRKISEERNYVSSFGGGTQGWVAPEILLQFEEEEDSKKYKFNFSSDIFSLGCVYYYVLSDGKHPFGARLKRTSNIIDGKHTMDARNIGADNVHLIKIMISEDPHSRPSCSALLSYSIFLKNTEESKKSTEKKKNEKVATESESQIPAKATVKANQLPQSSIIPPKQAPPAVTRKLEGREQYIQGGANSNTQTTQTNSGEDKTKSSNHFKGLIEAFNKSSNSVELLSTTPLKKLEGKTSIPPSSKPLKISQNKLQNIEKGTPATAIKVSPQKHSTQVPNFTDKLVSSNQGTYSDKVVEITKDRGQLAVNEKVDRLFEMVEKEDLTTIKVVLENFTQGINIREVVNKNSGGTLLHSAMHYQDEHVVQYLLYQQHFCKMLHEARFDDLISNLKFVTTIIESSSDEFNRKLGIICLLLDMRPDLVTCGNGILNHTLYSLGRCSESENWVKLLRIFLQRKADVNAKDELGKTPLYNTALYLGKSSHFLDIVKLLMEYQADPNEKYDYGDTFLDIACSKVSQENFHNLILYMVSIGKTDVFKTVNNGGLTILHYFVNEQHLQPETLELLVLNGADVNATTKIGNSVFMTATMCGHTDSFLNKLIEFGANWKIVNNNQNTALSFAVICRNLSAVKLLISLGCDVNVKNKQGVTPLHAVFYSGSLIEDSAVSIVIELINHGAIVNMKDDEGNLPVDLLAQCLGETQTVEQIRQLLTTA